MTDNFKRNIKMKQNIQNSIACITADARSRYMKVTKDELQAAPKVLGGWKKGVVIDDA